MVKFSSFLSRVSTLREPSPIRYLLRSPGMFKFAGGLPNPEGFPFEKITFKLKDGTQFNIEEQDLNYAFQYSNTEGIQPLLEFIHSHQLLKHEPKYSDWDVTVTTGSQDALSKSFEMLLNSGQGDTIIVETPCYTGALAALTPLEPNIITTPIDANGIIPELLEDIIKGHYAKNPTKKIKFLYCVPTGQNPSGATLTIDRKKKIYELATRYDFLILEDDPYFYLNLEVRQQNVPLSSDVSFLSMDLDGRVLRFDSLSKVLSSGLRIGWVTGHKELVERIHLHMQTNSLHTSGLSQKTVSKLLGTVWGVKGLENHVDLIQSLYRKQRDLFVKIIDKHLSQYVTYSVPTAGMFLWMKFNNIEDSKKFIEEKTKLKRVLFVPGQAFDPLYKPGPYARASFSIETAENMEDACIALKECFEQEYRERGIPLPK
ncbi:2-aminoadipate aminotransferase [Acrasis kona]|uniref:2-aminoadipate aminotransferase n=1 Tax=Acrasis kona TaxID=1008807 RepID=A0AAW2ZM02_9EUKA